MHELLKPLFQIWTAPPQQWHPVLIHFPIVFFILEFGLLVGAWLKKNAAWEKCAVRILHLNVWVILIVSIAGFHDVGLDLGRHHRIWLGIQDRWKNAWVFDSSVTVHVWLISILFVLTFSRLTWRIQKG